MTQPSSPRTLASDLDHLRRRVASGSAAALRKRVKGASTARRLTVIMLATVLPLAFVAVTLGGALQRTATLTGEAAQEVDTLVAPVLELSDDLAESRVLLDRYFTSTAEVDRAAFVAYARRIDAGFGDLKAITDQASPDVRQRATAALDSWVFIRDLVAAPDFAVPTVEEDRTALFATISSTISSIRRDLVDVADLASQRIATLSKDAEETASGMRLLLYAAVPISLIAGVVLVSWLVRDLRRGVRELREAAEALDRGRSEHRIPDLDHGDLAPVARSFNRMAERIESQARELHATANRDELTGVMNRRGFQADLDTELERAVRYERPTALLILDVDHFKSVNDTYGHPAGDVVLKAVADEVQDAVRGVDRVGRWGGEEFAILLPETPQDDARHVAERINRVIRQRVVIAGGEAIRVTASIGVAIYDPSTDGAVDVDELLSRADTALYEAKTRGRDRVVFAS